MVRRLLRFLQGYLLVNLQGYSPERFINLCINKGLILWDIKKADKEYRFYISVKSFKQIKPIVRKSHSKISIIERHGFPFFLHRNRHRKMYFIGILFFACVLYVLSLFIWEISLEGNYSYTENEIVKYLEECGIKHGALSNKIDCEEIEKKIRNTYFDITWVSAEISGTRLIIHIKENFDNYIVEEEKEPYDLISSKDGEVVSIITRAGTPLITVGSMIKKDDVLVTGSVDILNDSKEVIRTEYVNADADIYAKTVYQYNDEFSLIYKEKQYTEREKHSYYFYLSDKILCFKFGKVKYDNYDTITNDIQIRITKNFYLPIYYGKSKYKEYIEIDKEYTKEEAIALANKNYQLYLEKLVEKGIQILEKDVKIEFNGGNCIATGPITVIEKMGTIKPIDINAIEEKKKIESESNNEVTN